MTTFDPKEARERAKKQMDAEGIPPGDYLLAIRSFKRRTSQRGKPFLRAQLDVVHGSAKGKRFFDSISLDVESPGAAMRLSLLCEQCGVDGPIDLSSDDEVRQHLTGRPFKARVSRKYENGYTNNSIERYLVGDSVSPQERDAMDAWTAEEAERQQWSGDGYDGSGLPDDVPPPTEDDIPF